MSDFSLFYAECQKKCYSGMGFLASREDGYKKFTRHSHTLRTPRYLT